MTHELQPHSEASFEQFELTAVGCLTSPPRTDCQSLSLGSTIIQGHQQWLGKCSLLGNTHKKNSNPSSECSEFWLHGLHVSQTSAQDGLCRWDNGCAVICSPEPAAFQSNTRRSWLGANPCEQNPKVGWGGCGFSKARS